MRRFDKARAYSQKEDITNLLKEDMANRGEFLKTKHEQCFYISNEDQCLYKISKDNVQFQMLMLRYGVNPSDPMYDYIFDGIRLTVLMHGKLSETHSFAHYDNALSRMYVFDQDGQVFRYSDQKWTKVNNGTDGVLFEKREDRDKIDLEISDIEEADKGLLHSLIISKINFAESPYLSFNQYGILFLIWVLSLFFGSRMRSKIISCAKGDKGSGKTYSFRAIGKTLFGSTFDVIPVTKEEDFDIAVTQEHLCVFDNVDDKRNWLNDKLACVATGGVVKKRKLYTDDVVHTMPIRAFVALTSRTPKFRRDDVADRLLIFNVERLNQYISENVLMSEVLENRTKLLASIFRILGEIVDELKKEKDVPMLNARMADFATFAYQIAPVLGAEGEIETILEGITKEQSEFTLENQVIFEILEIWMSRDLNPGREVTTKQLYLDFDQIALEESLDFSFFKSVPLFGKLLQKIKPNIQQFYKVTDRKAGQNVKYFKFEFLKDSETKFTDVLQTAKGE
jgi:hypothetical protein